MKLSANLGFLWPELSLPERIRAAAKAGFDAVECHFPYDEDPETVRKALEETNLPMLALNTWPGDREKGELGLGAVPGKEARARAAIEQAVTYGARIGARNVHVMAGKNGDLATFLSNLEYAATLARNAGMGIFIEPINQRDAPDYFLRDLPLAQDIVNRLGDPVKIMFDCYHLQIISGDLLRSFEKHRDSIAHVQFASVPHRAEPDMGEVNFAWLLPQLRDAGYQGHFGAEYIPRKTTDGGLGWIRGYQAL